MKASILFITVLLGFTAAAVQAQSVRTAPQPDEHTARLERQISKISLLNGNVQAIVLRRQTTQAWENDAWVDSDRTTYSYSGELQTEALTEAWDGDSWEPTARTVTSYSGGLVEQSTIETWMGTSWAPQSRSLYTYSSGQLAQVLYQDYVNNAWVDTERTTVTMSNGNLASSLTETWDGQSWVPSDRYSLSQEGNDVVTLSEEWSGSAWVNTDRTVFLGLTIAELFEIFQELETDAEGDFGFSFLLRFPDSVQQEWDGSQWTNVSRQLTERDASDRPIVVTTQTWEEGEWINAARYAASYDGSGRLATVSWEFFDEEQWTPFMVETYAYNSAGLLESIVHQLDFGFGLNTTGRTLFEWTNTASSAENGEMPSRISLEPLYPNPFNPQATVRFHLASPEHARIRVFDATGRLVATLVDGVRPSGEHTIVFDAGDLPSGVYLVRLETATAVEAQAVTLLR